MGWRRNKGAGIGRNPIIISTTPREPMALYIPKSVVNIFLFLLIVTGLFYIFFVSDYFKVKRVIFEGSITSEGRAAAEKSTGENIFYVNNYRLADEVRKVYPQAYWVKIYKGLPDVIKVVTAERTVSLVWQSNNQYYLVDDMGIAFRAIESIASNEKWLGMPLVIDTGNFKVELGKRLISSRFIDFITYIHDNFSEVEGCKLVGIEVAETSFHPVLVTDLGWKVFLDSNRSAEDQLNDLKLILNKHKGDIHEYVDLRIEGWGYYK